MGQENARLRDAFGIYFLIVIGFISIRLFSALGAFDFLGGWGRYVFAAVVQIGLLFCTSVFLFSARRKQSPKKTLRYFQFKKISKMSVFISILIGFVLFYTNIFCSSFFNSIIRALGYSPVSSGQLMTEYPVWLMLINIIFTAVLPAICEETVHRGMLLKSSKEFGFWKAIIISSLLFGLLHLNIEQFFYATLIGVLLGYITLVSGSIWPAVIIHFMNNALSVFLSFSQVNGLGFGGIFNKISLMFNNSVVLGSLFVVCFVILLLYLLFALVKWLLLECKLTKIKKSIKLFEKLMDSDRIDGEDILFLQDNIEAQIVFPKEKRKVDIFAKLFLWVSASMMSVITIFTFVWGVL